MVHYHIIIELVAVVQSEAIQKAKSPYNSFFHPFSPFSTLKLSSRYQVGYQRFDLPIPEGESLHVISGNPYKKSHKTEMLLKNEKYCTLNVQVFYPSRIF